MFCAILVTSRPCSPIPSSGDNVRAPTVYGIACSNGLGLENSLLVGGTLSSPEKVDSFCGLGRLLSASYLTPLAIDSGTTTLPILCLGLCILCGEALKCESDGTWGCGLLLVEVTLGLELSFGWPFCAGVYNGVHTQAEAGEQ